jgi:hypothetical protein
MKMSRNHPLTIHLFDRSIFLDHQKKEPRVDQEKRLIDESHVLAGYGDTELGGEK